MKLLFTGGACFIGSAVIRYTIHNTVNVMVYLDKLTYAGSLASLCEISGSERYAFEWIDICDHVGLKRIFRELQPDTVMHVSDDSHLGRSTVGPAIYRKLHCRHLQLVGRYPSELGVTGWVISRAFSISSYLNRLGVWGFRPPEVFVQQNDALYA